MKTKIAALIETRKIIALMFATLFFVMSLRGQIPVEYVYGMIGTAIGYYFGGSTARDNPKKEQ